MSETLALIQNVLDGLREAEGFSAASLVRRDGILIAASLPEDADSNSLAAMTAAIVGTSEQSAVSLKLGEFSNVIIEASGGKIISIGISPLAILSCIVGKNANLGLVMLTMRKAGDTLKGSLLESE